MPEGIIVFSSQLNKAILFGFNHGIPVFIEYIVTTGFKLEVL